MADLVDRIGDRPGDVFVWPYNGAPSDPETFEDRILDEIARLRASVLALKNSHRDPIRFRGFRGQDTHGWKGDDD
jgi:hypothetical protein